MQLNCRLILIAMLGWVCLVGCPVSAQPDSANEGGPKATVDQLAWIAGHWQGEAMGGKFEESWNPPMGGAMMGMFKFVENDKVGFYELLTIVPQGESLVLRLKHFHADLKGWEEKDKSVDFPLMELGADFAKFDGLTFRKLSADRMDIDVTVEQGDSPQVLKFKCQRVKRSAENDSENDSSAAIDLLSDSNLSQFRSVEKWQLVGAVKAAGGEFEIESESGSDGQQPSILINGTTVNHAPYLFTKDEFGDVRVQLEFMVPEKSNAGVYLMGRYEVQILDSFGVENPGFGDLGGIYERTIDGKGAEGVPPKFNAAKPPGQWQTMDITFRAPRFDADGKKTASAKFERVLINGQLVQENQSVNGPTVAAQFGDETTVGPISIQGDHGPIAIRKYVVIPIGD